MIQFGMSVFLKISGTIRSHRIARNIGILNKNAFLIERQPGRTRHLPITRVTMISFGIVCATVLIRCLV